MNLLQILQDAVTANLTVVEAVFLLILAVLAYKKRGCAPEYNEEVQLRIELWPNAGEWQATSIIGG